MLVESRQNPYERSCLPVICYYYFPVKPIMKFLSIGMLCSLFGCAANEYGLENVDDRVANGLQGRGRIVENNPTGDSFGPEYR